ncbi:MULTISPECIES: tyrosine-type recombinase/integrase [Paraburkholderia]|uniref:tyrosine-type recombinase/integrase n=1 Tax=Paraburkholderia TaxID=1822464 RepID=UPI002250F81F|nr:MULTISPECIES: tyrosine-type recombinase/integrase [Paraburkholderia]MCX4163586.1 tyrosine-type recombinase/integrase [Paraburkholderia megapolitana]MDN7159081.1 tyrosine-type recombinase/integrase [Paraburkholderia sp. CHISQ3]MDQ6496128.1 tyrosine-type recombinase/integrase [Paraburkholderia megapolitana]
MNPAHWIDIAASPPQPLPDSIDAALDYLAGTTGHPVYIRWTLSRLKRGCPSLADAKREHPTVFALLLEHEAAVEYWDRGRRRIVAADHAPSPEAILERTLHQHRRRFHRITDGNARGLATNEATGAATAVWLAVLEPPLAVTAGVTRPLPPTGRWLARAGRFVNPSPVTNTLGVVDDAQAIVLFLRDRASRSPHTLRAYLADLRRLIAWCAHQQLGPLSDLTRHDLLAYRRALERGPGYGRAMDEPALPGTRHRAHPGRPATPHPRSAATPSRALAVVSSLFRYWLRTGYLSANPAADLPAGGIARVAWTPNRIIPSSVVALCDAVIAGATPAGIEPLVWARRCAIWSLYRYAGVRLAELVWSEPLGLPRLEVDAGDHWTLHVCGKGRRLRAIPLPAVCVPPLRAYRLARGLPATPAPFERLPVIHSERREALGTSGLYDQVKAVFHAAEDHVAPGDGATLTLLRAASTHWLRHGYARTLVIDHAVPLPVAQQLLGHASVQTTAAYAKTDLTQTRAFVEGSFPGPED